LLLEYEGEIEAFKDEIMASIEIEYKTLTLLCARRIYASFERFIQQHKGIEGQYR